MADQCRSTGLADRGPGRLACASCQGSAKLAQTWGVGLTGESVLLELFSGMGKISRAFVDLGGKACRVDWSPKVEADLHVDVASLTVDDVVSLCGRIPDAVWASPQCTSYSVASTRHRTLDEWLQPKTDLAAQDDAVNLAMWALIDELTEAGMKYYFVENPMGRMRHMGFVRRRPRWTVTYCTYGGRGNAAGHEDEHLRKPTDIWTNHPNPQFLPPCSLLYPPHDHGRFDLARKRDYLSRGEMPAALVDHIARLAASIPLHIEPPLAPTLWEWA